jgi:hypothetical protein
VAVRHHFYANDLTAAEEVLDKELQRGRGDDNVLSLEKGTVLLASGQAAQAEQVFRKVRDEFDFLEQQSLAETSLSMLTDDQQLAYSGEDYERVLLRGYLALANLMQGGGDAEAYCLQVLDKQSQIIQEGVLQDGSNPKAVYQHVALAPYLRAALREESHRDFDDVSRYREMVVSWSPAFQAGQDDLARARFGRHSAPGHGVLYVFALVGQGPFKQEVEEVPSTAAVFAANATLAATGHKTLPPIVAPIKVPRVVASPRIVSDLVVSVNGTPSGVTSTLTDVSEMAIRQCEAERPQVVGRALVRRAIKEASVQATKQSMGAAEDSWEAALLETAGLVWQFTENADTRCWGLLPDRIQVLRLELPAGEYDLAIQPRDARKQTIGVAARTRVSLVDGRNTYLLTNFPGPSPVGAVLSSTRE